MPKDQKSEMSKYIVIDKYNKYEEGHPGYSEMMNVVLQSTLRKLRPQNGKILEIGSGTGNYTKRIGRTGCASVDAVEIDPSCSDYLTHKVTNGEIQNANLIREDFLGLNGQLSKKYDAINTTFADHHFAPKEKPLFLAKIKKLLKHRGEYILGDEFLPPHDEADPAKRVKAQIEYHGMVIEEAFKEGKVELPNLELDALVSGLRTTVRFIQQTVPEKSNEEFLAGSGKQNKYNESGVASLKELISRMKAINKQSLANPEKIPEEEITEKRLSLIVRLEKLAEEMTVSRRAGLEENPEKGQVGGDYKMTVKQYTDFLNNAGFNAVGYFEGPKPVGNSNDRLDSGNGTKSITLKKGHDHAGGVWVIRAQASKNQKDIALF